MIPEPRQTYLLELLAALGPAAKDFVIAGAQAIKFTLPEARGTKDFDFLLDVIPLRGSHPPLADILRRLGYAPVEGARNFQFEKSIPGSTEKMRIEFMAPGEATSAWKCKKAFTPAPVSADRSRSRNPKAMRFGARYRMAKRSAPTCASPRPMRSSCSNS